MGLKLSHAMFCWAILIAFLSRGGPYLTAESAEIRNTNPSIVDDDFVVVDVDFSLISNDVAFKCPSSRGEFPDEALCDRFYKCSNWTAALYRCPTELDYLFSAEKLVCDYAYDVHCGQRTRPDNVSGTYRPPPDLTVSTQSTTPFTATTTTTKSPIDAYNCTMIDGTFPHPTLCDYYYDCWKGSSTLLKCPINYLYDLLYCAPPESVDCGSRLRPGGLQCPPDSVEGKLYPDPEDCASFYSCQNGLPLRQTCAENLYFNKYLEVCDFQANVDCSDRGMPHDNRKE